ncbi:MAG: FIMAH domain-containing protein [Solirubrobacterales bacterium]
MPWGPRTALAALVAAVIAGCGSSDDKSIPSDDSGQLIAQLHQVQDQVEAGNCELAQAGAAQFKDSVSNLPASVDSDTKQDLTKLADNLVNLAENPAQCGGGTTGESGAVTSSTESSTTDSSTEPTESTSTTTSTTSTTEPDEEQPPSESSGEGQGNQGEGNTGPPGNIGGGGSGSGGVKP